jgi:hypothetical protein
MTTRKNIDPAPENTQSDRPRRRHGRKLLVAGGLAAAGLALGIVAIVGPAASSFANVHPQTSIQAGNSKTNCIDAPVGAALTKADQATGIKFNCIETFSNADPAWSDWVSPWVTHNGYGYNTWLAADPAGRQIVLTQNLIPTSAASDSNWAAHCAAGNYNTHATQLATNLVKSGFSHSVIRLGAEMNGTWNTGSLGTTVASWKQWGQCFAQEVKTMRAVPGTHLLFDWNVNANYRNIPLADFYPGNGYVNIIGIDAYDSSGISLPAVGSSSRWAALAGEPEGLNALKAFAAANGKPLSIPEWGTVTTQGDDGNYVTHMGAFVKANNVAYQSWFDAGDNNIFQLDQSTAPASLKAYVKAFG